MKLAATLPLAMAIILATGMPLVSFGMSDQVREMCQRAEQLLNSGKFKEAMHILNQANGIDPNCAEVHGYLGMAYQNSGHTSEAIPEYTKALQLNPQMSFINVNLGTCYMNANRMDQAMPYFQRYLQDNPNGPEAAQVRGYIQQAGARVGQQNLRGVVEQGQALLNQGRFPEAQAAFQQAVAQQPDFAPAHFFLGFALGNTGQYQQAITEFKEALRLDPNMKEASMNIASNYQSLGDCQNAITWYQTYLKQNPGSPKAADVRQRIDGLRRQMSDGGGGGGASSQYDYFGQIANGGRYFKWVGVPIRVCIAPGTGVAGFQPSHAQQLMEAFSMWSQASENRLVFSLVQDPSQANIYCEWTNDPRKVVEPGHPVEGGITKLNAQPMPDGSAGITGARVTILTNRGGAPLNNDDMKRVCLHEVGHALGLSGHSSVNTDIMFFSETMGMAPVLSQRDAATIKRLYANFPAAPGAAQPGYGGGGAPGYGGGGAPGYGGGGGGAPGYGGR
ncbi:MAG: tetratricopeptide repeat protein [Candidatus Obscuribacterales bacterium]